MSAATAAHSRWHSASAYRQKGGRQGRAGLQCVEGAALWMPRWVGQWAKYAHSESDVQPVKEQVCARACSSLRARVLGHHGHLGLLGLCIVCATRSLTFAPPSCTISS